MQSSTNMLNNTFHTTPNNTVGQKDECARFLPPTPAARWAQVIFLIIVILVSLVANSFVIAILQRKRKINKVIGLIVINLSVTEILAVLVKMTLGLAMRLSSKGIPYVNDGFAAFFCKTLMFTDCFCHDLAVMSLIGLALDRFLGVMFPLKKYMTGGRAKKLITMIWFLALMANSIMLHSAVYNNNNDKLQCGWDPFAITSERVFIIFQCVFFYIIPLCIMGVLYSMTVHKLWVRRIPGNVSENNQRLEHQIKVNVLKMCIAVVVMFALCWLPLNAVHLINVSGLLPCFLPKNVKNTANFISFAGYAVNPLIYFMFIKDFRKGFCEILGLKTSPALRDQAPLYPNINHQTPKTPDLKCNDAAVGNDIGKILNAIDVDAITETKV